MRYEIKGMGDTITVSESSLDGPLGHWDEKFGEIIIEKDQPKAGKHVVLIHELFHVAETACIQSGIMNRRVNHEFVATAPAIILAALVKMGLYTGIGEEELLTFLDAHQEEPT